MNEILTPLIQKWLGTLVRAGLVSLGTYLVDNGLATADDWMTLSMKATPIILAVLWGLFQKYSATVSKALLRLMPAGTTNAEVKEEASKYTATEKLTLALKDGTNI